MDTKLINVVSYCGRLPPVKSHDLMTTKIAKVLTLGRGFRKQRQILQRLLVIMTRQIHMYINLMTGFRKLRTELLKFQEQ